VRHSVSLGRRGAAALAFALALGLAGAARSQTIIDAWSSVKAPPPPPLKSVTVDPKTTAFLELDLLKENCNAKVRPRCVTSIPKVRHLLTEARANSMLVVHSTFPGPKLSDTLPQVAPVAGEPAVVALADKFINTDLDRILKDHGIKTVIVVGAAAEGAVLYTASDAAMRGIRAVVPVDGMSSASLYAEQTVAYLLTHAPTIANRVTLTRSDMIKF
jgi:nicotinamidase-related amidase